jgi:hypothetical protein
VIESLVGSRPYLTVGHLVWSDAEGSNNLAAVRYSTNLNSYLFVCTSEPSIVGES